MNLAKHPWKGKASCFRAEHSSCVLYRWASPIELTFFQVLSTSRPLSPHVLSAFSGVPHGELVCPSVVHPRDVAVCRKSCLDIRRISSCIIQKQMSLWLNWTSQELESRVENCFLIIGHFKGNVKFPFSILFNFAYVILYSRAQHSQIYFKMVITSKRWTLSSYDSLNDLTENYAACKWPDYLICRLVMRRCSRLLWFISIFFYPGLSRNSI